MKFWFCIFASMLGLAVTSAAQTVNVKTTMLSLGDQVVIIPTPVGFEEAASQFEEIKKRMTATEDPNNDVLAVHMPREVCDKLREGGTLTASYEENGTRRSTPVLGGLSFLRVKDRLLYVYTYRNYASKNDIEVLQDFTRKWIGEILSAN